MTPLLSWVFCKINTKVRAVAEVIGSLLIAILWFGSTKLAIAFKIWSALNTMLPWILCFFVGYLISEHGIFEYLYNKVRRGQLLSYIILIFSVIIRCLVCKDWNDLYQDIIIAPMFIYACWSIYLRNKQTIIFRGLHYIGKYSMDIWLIHTFFAYYYFSDFIYSFKYDILIYFVCMLLSVLSAMIVQMFWRTLLNRVRR